MINPILDFSVRQRMLVILGTIVIAGFGVLAVKQIPIDAFPDVTNVQVQVIASAGGMSPPEVEAMRALPVARRAHRARRARRRSRAHSAHRHGISADAR